ncbi:MBL fold metallo-hydrolase [Primorskyibacter flagellatus]|uniref:Glyoxylase, beta-lactamase superfamily II n=1 Tax=Primorskyibacter flagellatus TaxID=1387277 RepID=A0A1W2BJT4_9RHOB|nr:MBL fold metallo-hydrolase [Primorskyibacter flagellatus]SMC73205.1 Glyoxylase, beta-lactamase superfamily II [Primorskyibacter flagellatus]
MKTFLIGAVAAVLAQSVWASEDIADQYPQSELYSKPVEVIPHVFSAIGATAPPTYENSGHNNNLSFVVTGDGVVVVNGGASARLAAALHDEIRAVTDQPVRLVINENGQGHAMLGNSYWADQGVDILAHVEAIEEIEENGDFILQAMQGYNRDKADGTRVAVPNMSFEDRKAVEMGDVTLEVLHLGAAHGPGDTQVWIPQWSLMIAGDIAFHERMPPIFADTCTSCWIETWETALVPLNPTYVIPGHGHPTNLAQVTRYTHDYLVDLRAKIGAHLEEGGDLAGAYYVDQTNWAHLDTFEELATKNAGRVFEEMEWE